jgi:hypothetical protein
VLTNCERHGAGDPNRDGHRDFRAHVQGRVAWVEAVAPETRLILTQVALAAYRERDHTAANHLRNISKTPTRACRCDGVSRGPRGELHDGLHRHRGRRVQRLRYGRQRPVSARFALVAGVTLH